MLSSQWMMRVVASRFWYPIALSSATSDAVTIAFMLARVRMDLNELSGAIPDELASLTSLQFLDLPENELSGAIPSVTTWSSMSQLDLRLNRLSGVIPDAVVSWSSLVYPELSGNRISGAIPDALATLATVDKLCVSDNRLSGALPDTLACLSSLVLLFVHNNRLSGAIPESAASWPSLLGAKLYENNLAGALPVAIGKWSQLGLRFLRLTNNWLSGAVPDAVASWLKVGRMDLTNNDLSGALPYAVTLLLDLQDFLVNNNKLSGTIPVFLMTSPKLSFVANLNGLSGTIGPVILIYVFVVSDNQLEGSLPWVRSFTEVLALAGNILEGSVPASIGGVKCFLDISSLPGKIEGVRGALPQQLEKGTELRVLIGSHQSFEGFIPALTSTLTMLALHGNRFEGFPEVHLSSGQSMVFVSSNMLSCRLPRCGRASTRLSLSAIGNRVRHPARGFPAWVSPMERDSLFWTNDGEGLVLFLRMSVAAAVMLVAANLLETPLLLSFLAASRGVRGRLLCLAMTCSLLLSSMAWSALVRLFFLALLLAWDAYKCPQTLALASACLRHSALTHILVCLLWGHFCFLSPAADSVLMLEKRTSAKRSRLVPSRLLRWLMWLLLTLLLAIPSGLYQASKSVPGLLSIGELWLMVISACIGAFQGVLGAIITPRLAAKLTSLHKHAYAAVANVLVDCVLPAAIVILLDAKCLGNWATLWEPCRLHAKQFQQVIVCTMEDRDDCTSYGLTAAMNIRIAVLRKPEVCDPHTPRGQRAVADCIETTLLRLQGIWFGKLITSGVLLPASRVGMGKTYSSAAKLVAKFATLVSFAAIASGHLPLMMPMVLLGVFTETLLAAASWNENDLVDNCTQLVATPSLVIAQVTAFLVQLVSASADLTAFTLVCLLFLKYMVAGFL